MANLVSICSIGRAEFGAVKGQPAPGVVLIPYLYWLEFWEKREWRRRQWAVEQRSRERETGLPQK